jgi:hypothetical protein
MNNKSLVENFKKIIREKEEKRRNLIHQQQRET